MSKSKSTKRQIDIFASALELAELLKEEPTLAEGDILSQGSELVGIFTDPNFSETFLNLKELKRDTLKMAIEDVAMGAITLKNSNIGLSYKDGKIIPFINPHKAPSVGNVIYSITWKNIVAFKNWRKGPGEEIPQEYLNAAIYRLSLELSRVLD